MKDYSPLTTAQAVMNGDYRGRPYLTFTFLGYS